MPNFHWFAALVVIAAANIGVAQEATLTKPPTVHLSKAPITEPFDAKGKTMAASASLSQANEGEIVTEWETIRQERIPLDPIASPVVTEVKGHPGSEYGRCSCRDSGNSCEMCKGSGCPCYIRSPGNMVQHFPYDADNRAYYYFRPYQWFHVPAQASIAQKWGAPAGQPYSNDVFKQVYTRLSDTLDR